MPSRMRWVRNHADLAVIPYFCSTSRAEMPFLLLTISNSTNSQVRSAMCEPWKMVPVVTENCLRHALHVHSRRWVPVPRFVVRDTPLRGLMK